MCRFHTCNHPLPVESGRCVALKILDVLGACKYKIKSKFYNKTVGSIYQGMHCNEQGTGDEFHYILNFIATS